jgi:hypothetical protein
MMRDDLTQLLGRIERGEHTPDELERARALARQDDRLPEELRHDVLTDEDAQADAGALLSLLDADPFAGLVGQAVFDAAGIDIADAVLAAIGSAEKPPVAEAVREEAGSAPDMEVPDDGWLPIASSLTQGLREAALGFDVSAAILAAIGDEAAVPVAQAVRELAGDVDVVPAVLAVLGHEWMDVAAAVREEAGIVDIVEPVMDVVEPAWLCGILDGQLPAEQHRAAAQALMRDPALGLAMTGFADIGQTLRAAVYEQAGTVSMWASIAPQIGIADPEEVVGWDGQAFALALRTQAGTVDVADAVMLRVQQGSTVVVPVAVPEPANATPTSWRSAVPALVMIAAAVTLFLMVGLPTTPSQGTDNGPALQFASASEVTIEDLSYADNVIVHVIPAEGDGPLIVWVDEEVTL